MMTLTGRKEYAGEYACYLPFYSGWNILFGHGYTKTMRVIYFVYKKQLKYLSCLRFTV